LQSQDGEIRLQQSMLAGMCHEHHQSLRLLAKWCQQQ
jgi:hypothetical protein